MSDEYTGKHRSVIYETDTDATYENIFVVRLRIFLHIWPTREYSDQTGRMRMLIGIIVGCTCLSVRYLMFQRNRLYLCNETMFYISGVSVWRRMKAISILLKGATKLPQIDKNYKLYMKRGNHQTALKDFYLIQPTDVFFVNVRQIIPYYCIKKQFITFSAVIY